MCDCFGDGCNDGDLFGEYYDDDDYMAGYWNNFGIEEHDDLSIDTNTFTFYFSSDPTVSGGYVILEWECVDFKDTVTTTTATTSTEST